MNTIAITGAQGFLGWHTRCAIAETGAISKTIKVGQSFSIEKAVNALENSSSLIHIAGVNRGTDAQVYEGNIVFSKQVRAALLECKSPPEKIIFANSIQSRNGGNYGVSKQISASILEETAKEMGILFDNVQIPNVFGEHGRPFYNAVTSTFCYQVSEGITPEVTTNSVLNLVHAQDVADCLLGKISNEDLNFLSEQTDVENLLTKIRRIAEIYGEGEIPDLSDTFTRNLFNTYRSYLFPNKAGINLEPNKDNRGSFFEIIRSNGGQGQFSFSTTLPGVSRGDHFHRRKIERFTVLSGKATINIRKMFSDEKFSFQVSGENPIAIDMPTMWTHNITNTGDDLLYTAFWINELFDPSKPDTIYEKVAQ